jgi:hypothetical protein
MVLEINLLQRRNAGRSTHVLCGTDVFYCRKLLSSNTFPARRSVV